MPCTESVIAPGTVCPGEIVLGNPFLVRSGLIVTEFIADNIQRLANIDYGYLNKEEAKSKIGKLGIFLLKHSYPDVPSCQSESLPDDISYNPSTLVFCNMVINGDFL
eukprot:IDg7128t1